jgi:hypothetical protein
MTAPNMMQDDDYKRAMDAISRGANRDSVIARYEQGEGSFDDLVPTKTGATLGEDVAGVARQFANKAMFGAYPKVAGALQSIGSGRSAKEEAQRIQGFMDEYNRLRPTQAKVARGAGEIAPYLSGGRAVLGAMGAGARKAGLGKALAVGEAAYKTARSAPVVGSVGRAVLPSSAASAAEIALLEGTRGATEAAPDESRIAEALKRASMGQAFGRAGEVVGTYAAGKVGPTLGKIATKAKASADEIGEQIGAWKAGAPVPITPGMSQLYQKSKLLRDAVDEEAQNLGLMSNSPVILARAYSKIVRDLRGTPDMADVQREVLQPFLREIDTAAQGKLSPLIRKYSNASKAGEAVETARDVVKYVRTGAGEAGKVSPEAITAKAAKSYTSQAERDALTQALIAELGQGGKESGTLLRRILMPLRGAGTVSDLAATIGGTPTFGQRMTQRGFRGLGASRAE